MVLMCSSFDMGWQLLAEIKINAKDIQTDRLGNVYAISNTNQLYKFDPNGKLLSTLNYAYLGNMSHIDASNPMELYVFYKELNTVVFLDNNLAFRGKVNLSEAGILLASALGRSNTNGLWVYDVGSMQLKRLNKDGSLVQESGNVRQFVASENFYPTSIVDDGLRIYVCDSSSGILVFDVFANYLKTIPITGILELRMVKDELFYVRNKQLISYRTSTYQRDTMNLPKANFIDFCIEKDRLFLMDSNLVQIYGFSKR